MAENTLSGIVNNIAKRGGRVTTVTGGTYNENNIGIMQVFIAENWKRPQEYDPQSRWRSVVGREQELAEIVQHLAPDIHHGNQFAIYGLTGMGKSALASTYTHRYGDLYPGGLLWANLGVDDAPTILNRWARKAYREDQWLPLQSDDTRLQFDADAVRQMLSGHGAMLVVFDDVSNLDMIEPLLPALPADAHQIITTRELRVAESSDFRLELRQLEIDHALLLLRRDLNNLPDYELMKLIQAVGAHPQTLQVVAAEIRHRSTQKRRSQALQTLLERIERGENFGLIDDLDSPTSFQCALKFTYDEIGDVPERDEFQRRMRWLGIIAPYETDFSSEMAAFLWDTDVDSAAAFLEMLRDRSLVTTTTEGRWMQHAMVRTSMRQLLKQVDEYEDSQAKYFAFGFQIANLLDNLPMGWSDIAADLSHMNYCTNFLVGWLEEQIQEQFIQLSIYDLIQFDINVYKLNSDELHVMRNLMYKCVPYAMSYLLPPQIIHCWLVASTIIGKLLDDYDMTMLSMFYWSRWFMHSNLPSEARAALDYLLEIARSSSTDARALALTEVGGYFRSIGETEGALRTFQEALSLVEEYSAEISINTHINLLIDLGYFYYSLSQVEKALGYIKQGYELLPPGEISYLRLQATQGMSLCYTELGKYEEALEFFANAEQYINMPGAFAVRGVLLNNRGFIHMSIGEMDLAMYLFVQALELAKQTNNISTQISVYNNMAQVHLSLNQFDEAVSLLEAAQSMLPRLVDKSLEARTISNLGVAYYSFGRPEDALHLLQKSLLMLSDIQDKTFAIQTLAVIGKVFQSTGQIERGLEFFNQMLPVIQELKDETNEVTIINWLALLCHDKGNLQEAVRYVEHAIPMLEQITNPAQRAPALTLIANTYIMLGRLTDALKSMEEALFIWKRLGNKAKESETLLELADCYLQMRNPERAQLAFDECLPLIEETINLPVKAAFYKIQGRLHFARQDYQNAIANLETSAVLSSEIGNHLLGVASLNDIAIAYMRLEDPLSAREKYEQAHELAMKINLPQMQALVMGNLGVLFFVDKQPDRGTEMLKAAIGLMEQNDLTVDSAGQTPHLLRAYIEIFNRLDEDLDLPPAHILSVLVRSTNWDMVGSLITIETLRDPIVEAILLHEIEEATNEPTLAEVLRMYRQIVGWARETSVSEVITRASNEYERAFVYHWWGQVLLSSEGYASALANINHAIELDGKQGAYYIDRGWAYRGLGNYPAALQDFDKGLRLLPKAAQGYLGRGVAYFESNNIGGAMADFERAIALNPNNSYAYQWYGSLLLHLDDMENGLNKLEKAIELDEGIYEHRYWRALLNLRKGEYDAADKDLTLIFHQDVPDSMNIAYTQLWRGLVRQLAGKVAYADADWQQASQIARKLLNQGQRNSTLALHAVMTNKIDVAYSLYKEIFKLRFPRHALVAQYHHLKLLAYVLPNNERITELYQWLAEEIAKTPYGNITIPASTKEM
jgi:tetratricopeptide (TPR) repeat protein